MSSVKIKKLVLWFKSFFGTDIVVQPEQGDVIEDCKGNRSLVSFVDEEDKVLVNSKTAVSLNRRGRSSIVISLDEIEWPQEGYLLYRGDKLLYPQKNYKLWLLVWLSNKLLKK